MLSSGIRFSVISLCLGVATTATAQTSDTSKAVGETFENVPTAKESSPEFKARSSILPEGKTLPQGVARFKFPFSFQKGSEGFDKDGNKKETGFNLSATGAGFIAEYGLSDRLSLQFGVPVVIRQELEMDKDNYLARDEVSDAKDDLKIYLASKLKDAGACPDVPTCLQAIESGASSPVDMPAQMPDGSTVTIPANVPFKDLIDSYVDEGALAAAPDYEDGKTGIGDIELGALYAVVTDGPVLFSAGAGFRLPTGAFKDVDRSKQLPTGRGTLDLGVRTNVDVPIASAAMLSWQHQAEVMLVKGKAKLGDEEVDFEREGVRSLGFVKAALGFGAFSDSLNPFAVYAARHYNYDGQARYDGEAELGRPQLQSNALGATASFVEKGVPLSLDVEYRAPASGKNVAIAPKQTNVTIKSYLRF